MPRKKSASPTPDDQEMLEQFPETTDGSMAEAAPSEEGMALMDQDCGAFPGDGDGGGFSDAPFTGEGMSGGGEPPYQDQEEPPPDAPFPGDFFEEGEPAYDGQPDHEAADADDYDAILRELGESGTGGGKEAPLPVDGEDSGEGRGADDLLLLSQESVDTGGGGVPDDDIPDDGGAPAADQPAPVPRQRRERPSAASAAASHRRERVLTIDARDEIQTDEDRLAIIWHEIQNSHRTRRILTGMLDGVEKTNSGLTLAVVNYKGFRVAIPVKEMMLYTGKTPSGREYIELMDQLNRILNARLGCEIDFIVKGYDNKGRSVVGSRRDAMLRKRQTFYMDADELGEHLIYVGRVVQARVVAVAEKVIRVEVFGVETSILARDLSWEWMGNARDHFSVGDRILVRVLKINRADVEHLSIRVDVRSVSATNSHDNLKKCMPQCRYAGRVTDVRNGVVFIRLNNGVNAIAHSCYDTRYPGKKDDVSFAVTRLDEEQGVAIGIITRIIKQNL